MSIENDLLAARRGSIEAPAGCGKTQVIAEALRRHRGELPVLVLTHTNAGISALRQRLQRLAVPSASYRLATIDGFSMRLATTFPRRSLIAPDVQALDNPRQDYPAIRSAALKALCGRHLDEVLAATYARLFVDEYQDCTQIQHQIVTQLSVSLPTCLLGDPMQAIFGFAGPLVDWRQDVLPHYPAMGQLQVPHRWINAGNGDLGAWLLAVRTDLAQGRAVDVRSLPDFIEYVDTAGDPDGIRRQVTMRATAASPHGAVLVIGNPIKKQGRYQLAGQTPGSTVVETVDLQELTAFAKQFNPASDEANLQLLEFASSLMTHLEPARIRERLVILRASREKTAPTPAEQALLDLAQQQTLSAARTALVRLREQPGVRVFRHEVFDRCLRAFEVALSGACSLHEAAVRERERFRQRGRPLSKKNIGSTLLLKGLEAEVSVLLEAEGMDARNLYVALTRASHRIIVCSSSPILPR